MTFTDLLLAVPFPHLTVFSHSTPEAVFVNSLRAILCSLNPCNVLYTDGSKSDSAFVAANREYMFRLPPEASFYTAEFTSIHRVLRIVGQKTWRLVVCTDLQCSVISVEVNILQELPSK